MKKKIKKEEYLSDWFIEGLLETGISEKEYHNMSQNEKNEIKKYFTVIGHY